MRSSCTSVGASWRPFSACGLTQAFDLSELFGRKETARHPPPSLVEKPVPIRCSWRMGFPWLVMALLAGPCDIPAVNLGNNLIFPTVVILVPPSELGAHWLVLAVAGDEVKARF